MKEESLRSLYRRIFSCKRCSLWKTRRQPVPGEGNVRTGIMLIGLGPGKEEDRSGRPFVGRAGMFLSELLGLAGLKRSDVYITNVMKCFLPTNKASDEQIKACTPYLDKQIEIIKPKVIVTLGNVATVYIFKKFGLKAEGISKIHGRVFEVNTLFGRIKVIPMYHPATALYNPRMKETLRRDWENIKKEVSDPLTRFSP